MSKPETPSSATYSRASPHHSGCMPATSPSPSASAPVTRSQVRNSPWRRGRSGSRGAGRAGRGRHGPADRSRGGRLGVVGGFTHHPRGQHSPHRPTGLLFLHGLGGRGLNERWELQPCTAQERSSFRPPRPSRSRHGLPTLRPRQAEPAAPTRLLLLPPRPAQSSP